MKKHIYSITLLSFSVTSSALSVGIEQGYHDPTAAARGNAFIASVENPSAVHYNPASLAWQKGLTLQSVAYASRVDIKHYGGSGSYKHNQIVPSGAFFLNQGGLLNGRLALGLGVTIPHGLGLEFDENYPLRTLGTEAYLAHLVISPAISYKVNDKFSLGMTLNYAYDEYDVKRGIITAGDQFSFNGSGDGWGYTIAALYKPTDRLSLAATYRSSIKTNVSGDATTTTILPVAGSLNEPASTGFNYPQQFTIGAAYQINNDWDVEANIQWTDWTSFDSATLVKPSGNITELLDYEDTILVGVGASRKLNDNTTLNFGYMFSTPAAPAKTYSPFVTNSELHVLSVGVDHTIEKWKLSAALLYVQSRERTVTGSATNPFSGVNADGVWNTSGVTTVFGASYKF